MTSLRAEAQDVLLDTSAGKPILNQQEQENKQPLASARVEAGVKAPSFIRATTHPRYNCHGLTFASRRTGIHDDGEINRILKEDGYKPIQAEHVLPGDCILYFNID